MSEAIESGGDGLGWALRDVCIYLGGAVGLLLGSLIVVRLDGVAAVFPALAPISLLMAVLLWRVAEPSLPSTPRVRPSLREVLPTPAGLGRSLRALSDPWLLVRISTTKGLASLGMGMGMAFLPLLALDVGVPAEWYLFAFAVSNVAAIPLSVLGGLAADRYSRKWLFVGNYTVEALMLGAFALTEDPVFFVGGLALYVAQTTFEPAVIAYFFDQFEDAESGRAWGLSGAISKAAGVGGPALGGALYVLNPNIGFAVGAVLTAAGALVAVTLPE